MELYGKLSELFEVRLRGDTFEVIVKPSTLITYDAPRTIELPDINDDDVLVSKIATQTLTNKTLTAPTLTLPVITVKDNELTIQDDGDATKQIQFDLSGLTASTTRTLTIPDIDSTLATISGAQTFTDKTLTSPVISTIVNTGTLTLPTSTDTLVGRDTTDTLTNKTLTTPQINEAVNLTSTSTELNQLDGVTVGGTAAGDIATLDATQTLTNKTLTTPQVNEAVTLTATSTELNQLDGITVGGTTAGDIVTLDATQTLTSKTLTSPVISTISNTGTLTLPTSTDTLIGRDTVDILTNKTLTTPSINTPQINEAVNLTSTSTELNQLDGVTVGGTAAGDITTIDATQTLTNKTLTAPTINVNDDEFTLRDNGDITKTAQFNLSDLDTATAYTYSIRKPDSGTTTELVDLDSVQTLSNKTLDTGTTSFDIKDTNFTLLDDGDSTKKAQFEASGITTATTRTFTFPDVDATLVVTEGAQTINGSKSFGDTLNMLTQNAIHFQDTTGGEYVGLRAPGTVTPSSYTLTLPAAQGGVNQFLQNDGSGGLQWATAASTTAGTSGEVVYKAGSGAFTDAANLFWDDVNDVLGVGTASPGTGLGQRLTLENSDTYAVGEGLLHLRHTGTAAGDAAAILFQTTETAGSKRRAVIGAELDGVQGGKVFISTRDSGGSSWNDKAFVVDDGGNVGIGTTDPGYLLNIVHDAVGADASVLTLRNNNITDNTSSSIKFINSTSSVSNAGSSEIAGRRKSGNGELGFLTYNGTSMVEAMTIDSSQNVGIGTSGPDTLLHVAGPTDGTQDLARFSNNSENQELLISMAGSVGFDIKSSVAMRFYADYDNDTSSGASYFDFYNDGNHSMRIDHLGNVGIGTTSPTAKLDVQNGALSAVFGATASEDRADATLKVARIGVPHYTNAEEPLGFLFARADSSVNELFIGGGTSTFNAATQIEFRTAANSTTTSGTARMTIDSSGKVGIGISSGLSHLLHVDAGTNTPCRLDGGNDTNYVLLLDSGTATGNSKMVFMRDSTLTSIGQIHDVAGTMTYGSLSDGRLKDNIEDIPEGLSEVLNMKPVRYNWKRYGDQYDSRGFVAQELYQIYPQAVSVGTESDDPEDVKTEPWAVDYGKLTPVLVKAIQELAAKVERLEAQLNA